MLRELITTIAFIIALCGITACFVFVQKSSAKAKESVEKIIELKNEIN